MIRLLVLYDLDFHLCILSHISQPDFHVLYDLDCYLCILSHMIQLNFHILYDLDLYLYILSHISHLGFIFLYDLDYHLFIFGHTAKIEWIIYLVYITTKLFPAAISVTRIFSNPACFPISINCSGSYFLKPFSV